MLKKFALGIALALGVLVIGAIGAGSVTPFSIIDFIGQAVAPTNPTGGKGRVYFSTSDNLLHCITSTGASCAFGGGGGGTVTAVTGTSPIVSSGGTTPAISCPTCNTSAATVTSVSFTGGLISVATPTTTPALTVAGTSGGIPYFSGAATWASSAALTANSPVLGGGAGSAPQTLPGFTTNGVAVLTVGAVGTGNGGVTFVGTTSGSVPCVVGASTSTVTCSGSWAASSAINAGSNLQVGGRNIFASTAPTITTGTGATIANSNGTSVFTINVGTGGLTSIVIGLPTSGVTNGWHCTVNDRTTTSATVFITKQTNSALSTSGCTIGNFTTAGASGAWTNSDLLSVSALPD